MSIKLKAEKRQGQQKLNPNFFIPAILYGNHIDNINLQVTKADFEKVWEAAGESNLIDLKIKNDVVKVLIKEVQYHPVKHLPIHIDFYQVNMKEKITTEIPLQFIGESKAVKELGGLLMKYTDAVEVRCLPGDLLDHIDVDISLLESFDDSIHMKDLNLPATMELLRDLEEIVVNVIAPKTEAEIEAEEIAEKTEAEKTKDADQEEAEEEKEQSETSDQVKDEKNEETSEEKK